MARPKKVVEEVKQQEEPKVESKNKEAIDSYDDAKKASAAIIEKDLLRKSIDELKLLRSNLQKEYAKLSSDYNIKERALHMLNNDMKAVATDKDRLQATIQKEKQDTIERIDRKLKEVQAADAEYKTLVAENAAINKKLKSDAEALASKERQFVDEKKRMEKYVAQMEGTVRAQQEDLATKAKELQAAQEKFESEKEELKPTMEKVSKIKNENEILLKKIDQGQQLIKDKEDLLNQEREKIAVELEAERNKLSSMLAAIENKHKQLREQEEKISDKNLELKSAMIDFETKVRRHNLSAKVSEADK